MRIIEIQEGICINSDKIEGIEKVTETTCKVYVGTRAYLATYPYETLMAMLKNEEVVDKGVGKDEQIKKTMLKLDKVLDTAQFFAG